MTKGLTRRQGQILDYIMDCIRDNGLPPTFAEIARRFHISSMNAVNDHLSALEKKGYITRSANKARSIYVTEKAATDLYRRGVALLPLVGCIAAGMPVLAEENIEDHVPVEASYAREGSFALRVQGDSMIEDGILGGDTVIVDPTITPAQSDVVVALVDGEATIKRYFRHGNMVELRPANALMSPLLVPAQTVQVQGVVVALQRRLR